MKTGMPQRRRRRGRVAIGLFVLVGAACAEPPDPIMCGSQFACGRMISACCSSTQCHYTLNGVRYDCDGTSCSAAAQRVARAACGAAPNPTTASAASDLVATSRSFAAISCSAALP